MASLFKVNTGAAYDTVDVSTMMVIPNIRSADIPPQPIGSIVYNQADMRIYFSDGTNLVLVG